MAAGSLPWFLYRSQMTPRKNRNETLTDLLVPLELRPTAVYRLYNRQGILLYVGACWNLEVRWAGHAAEKLWWTEVDWSRTRIDWYPDRRTAQAVELAAIRAEKPRYNIDGSDEGRARWRAARREMGKSGVPSKHRNPTVSVRPTQQVKDQAAAEFEARGWTVGDVLHAALLWVLDDPRRLAELERYRPAPKVKGRPRKKR